MAFMKRAVESRSQIMRPRGGRKISEKQQRSWFCGGWDSHCKASSIGDDILGWLKLNGELMEDELRKVSFFALILRCWLFVSESECR